MPRKAPEKTRKFIFTLFNHPMDDQVKAFMSKFNFTYWYAGDEICPSTERQHWQGWLYLKAPRTLQSMIKEFDGSNGHILIMNGTFEQNFKYCSDEGKNRVLSAGTKPKGQGFRSDIEEALECTSIRELFETQTPNFQTIRVVEKHLEYCETPKFREVNEIYMMKTDWDEEDHSCEHAYIWNDNNWHGYDGQTILIVFHRAMNGMDIPQDIREGIPKRVNVGGSSRQLRIDMIIYVQI